MIRTWNSVLVLCSQLISGRHRYSELLLGALEGLRNTSPARVPPVTGYILWQRMVHAWLRCLVQPSHVGRLLQWRTYTKQALLCCHVYHILLPQLISFANLAGLYLPASEHRQRGSCLVTSSCTGNYLNHASMHRTVKALENSWWILILYLSENRGSLCMHSPDLLIPPLSY